MTGSTVGSRLGVAPPTTVMRFLTPMIPMARNGAATVVSPGSTISASATLSKPMTLTSSGTPTPALRSPLMTPMAITSLKAITAVAFCARTSSAASNPA